MPVGLLMPRTQMLIIGVRMPLQLVKALDLYVAQIITNRPPQRVIYTRQDAIRDLLTEALETHGIREEAENLYGTDESPS